MACSTNFGHRNRWHILFFNFSFGARYRAVTVSGKPGKVDKMGNSENVRKSRGESRKSGKRREVIGFVSSGKIF